MKKKKINEIFYSLQGEGFHSGVPSVFVRFSGCNLRCPFCDTQHADGLEMNDDEIFREVNRYPANWVILTGGEPSLFIDTDFISKLKAATGKKIAIETNGTRPLPEGIDWITVSPKTGISGLKAEAKAPQELTETDLAEVDVAKGSSIADSIAVADAVVLEYADEIKVVDVGQPLKPYFALPCRKESTRMYLQPCHVPSAEERTANRERTVARVLADPRWTLSVQLHRYLGIE